MTAAVANPLNLSMATKLMNKIRKYLTISLIGICSVTASSSETMRLQMDSVTGRLELVIGELTQDLGQLRFVSRKAGAGDHVVLDRVVSSNASDWVLRGNPEMGEIRVSTEDSQAGELHVSIDLSGLNRTGLFRPVIALADSDAAELAVGVPPRRVGARVVARTDLGLVVLAAEYDPTNVARAMIAPGDGSLVSWRLHSRVIDMAEIPPFRLRFRMENVPVEVARDSLAERLRQSSSATAARLEAWHSLFGDEERGDIRTIEDRLERFAAGLDDELSRTGSDQEALLQAFLALKAETEEMANLMMALARDQREELRAAARARFSGMNYRAGVARDALPRLEEYDDWALFRMGLARLAVNPVWHEGLGRDERIERVRGALDHYADFDAKVILSVHEEQEALGPADLTFTNEFIPVLRSGFHEFGFNSARLRQINLRDFGDWLDAVDGHPALWTYKIDNEPFWSTQEYPIFGYDEATVGCDPDVFVAAMKEVYPTLEKWRNRVAGSLADAVIPWREWSDVALVPGESEGLTFVDFLRGRYRTLDELNRVWGSDYRAWSRVFPPLPMVSGAREADDSGAPEFDIGAFNPGPQERPTARPGEEVRWADWTRFWAHNINDELRGFVALGRSRGTAVPITSNAIGGHILATGDVTHSLFPWVTSDGLDALAIDFYRMGYLQGYMRILAGAAGGRPFEIHETGGSDNQEEAWYVTAFAYAYGARGTLFWRRDHIMPPTSALGIARAIDVLDELDLQQNSRPLTDGILMVYPFEGLHTAGAWDASPSALMERMQGAVMLAKRRQWQYTVVAERDVALALDGEGVHCVVVPAGAYLAANAWAALAGFVERGGALLVTDDFGTWDERGTERLPNMRRQLFAQERVHVVSGDAWLELTAGLTGPRDSRLGLAGPTPEALNTADAFVRTHAPAIVRYTGPNGQLVLTHTAIRKSDQALYVFVDPWTDEIRLETTMPVKAANDLARNTIIEPIRTRKSWLVEVKGGSTVVRLEIE